MLMTSGGLRTVETEVTGQVIDAVVELKSDIRGGARMEVLWG